MSTEAKAPPIKDAGKLDVSGYEALTSELVKLEPGQAFEGKYVSKRIFETSDVKTGVVKQVNIWELETEPGVKWGLMGITSIDDAFSRLSIGDEVTVIRYGDKKTSGKRTMHDVKVFRSKQAKQ